MAVGFPAKTTFADGNALPASDLNDITGTLNLIRPTAKGDIFVGSANNTYTRLAIASTNGLVLAVSTGAATGVAWTALTSTAAVQIGSQSTTSGTSLSFSSIPTTGYSHLMLVGSLISTTSNTNITMTSSAFSGGNYTSYYQEGVTTTTLQYTAGSTSSWAIGRLNLSSRHFGFTAIFPNYSSTTFGARGVHGFAQGTGGLTDNPSIFAGNYSVAAAISGLTVTASQTISGNLVLYGLV